MKTELDELLSYGLDSQRRRLYFGSCLDSADEDASEFTQKSVEVAVRGLHRLIAENASKPIELHMSSLGGDTWAMMRLFDEIQSSSAQIKFFGGGTIMSAATWIMSACDERYLYPHATVMVHNGSDWFSGNHTDTQIFSAHCKALQDKLCELFATNSKMPKEFWEDILQRDLYLTAEEAITLGLADKIVEPKKRGNLRKIRQTSLKKTNQPELEKLITSIYERINKRTVPKLIVNKPVKEPEDTAVRIDSDDSKSVVCLPESSPQTP